MSIDFPTLRSCSGSLLAAIPQRDRKRVRLSTVRRICRTPRVFDQRVRISGYPDDIRQPAVRGPGHERPTLPLTNQVKTSASQLVDRCDRRMVTEKAIADAINVFHIGALSAVIPKKIDPDLQITLMASGLSRLRAVRVGNGTRNAKSRTLFRGLVKAPADITIENHAFAVRIGRGVKNPFLLNAPRDESGIAVPWLGNRRLRPGFL